MPIACEGSTVSRQPSSYPYTPVLPELGLPSHHRPVELALNKPPDPNVPTFSDVYLKQFSARNPHCVPSIDGSHLLIEKPWGREDVRLRASIDDHEFINDLNNIVFSPRFDAIYHTDTKTIEFIFAYVNPKDPEWAPYIERQFALHFGNYRLECSYAEPTARLLRVAKAYEQLPSDLVERSAPLTWPGIFGPS